MNVRKKWIIAALILLGAGILICGISLAATGFDIKKLSNETFETNTYEVREAFEDISIETVTDDIEFVLSEDSKCSVVCLETEKASHDVKVEDHTLKISTHDSRKWFDFFDFSFQTPKITVYLPEAQYAALSISDSTGDIGLPEHLTFDEINIRLTTGDVSCSSSCKSHMKIEAGTGDINVQDVSAGQMTLSVTTGNIRVTSAQCEGIMELHVTTGDTRLEGVTGMAVRSTGTTGDLIMKNVLASDTFGLERGTGDIRLDSCDAGSITAKTTTGDITGTLLSDKVFITHTGTGDVHVPASTEGGSCELTTSTGDIFIDGIIGAVPGSP